MKPLLEDNHYRDSLICVLYLLYLVITHPMDFSTISDRLREGKYEYILNDEHRYEGENHEQFWSDLYLIVNNVSIVVLYNF